MKKSIAITTLSLLIATLSLTAGCSNGIIMGSDSDMEFSNSSIEYNDSSNTFTEYSSVPDSSVFPDNSSKNDQKDFVDIELLPIKSVDWGNIFDEPINGSFEIVDKLGGNYYGFKSVNNGFVEHNETLISDDLKKEKSLKYPNDLPEWSVGSGSFVTLQNKYLYEWLSYTSQFSPDSTHDMKLTRVDGDTGVVEVIDELELSTPFIYLENIDDNSFLSYSVSKVKSDVTDYATLSSASIYYLDGTKNEIISEKYENDVSWSDSVGILIENFAIRDGEIYGVGRRRISGQYIFFLYHYDREGNLLDTHELKGLEEVMVNNQAMELFLVGDYILFRTYGDLTSYICKIAEDGMTIIAKGSHYAISGQNIFFIESNVDSSTDTIRNEEIPLYSIDTLTDKIVAVNFDIPIERPYFVGLSALSNGDLLFKYCSNGTYDPMNYTNYVLPIDKVNSLISLSK